jgi:WhiB family redox-sensing transcriptional regulator
MIPAGTRWEDYAVCRQFDPDLFFPGKNGKEQNEREMIRVACRVCPVRQRCLDYALSRPEPQYGVWGGLTERQLGQARKSLGRRYGYAARNPDEKAA